MIGILYSALAIAGAATVWYLTERAWDAIMGDDS